MTALLIGLGAAALAASVILYFAWNIKGIVNDLSGKSSRKRVARLKAINSGDPSEVSTTNMDVYHDVQGAIDELDRSASTGTLSGYGRPDMQASQEAVYGRSVAASVVDPAPVPVKETPVVREVTNKAEGIDPFGVTTRFNLAQKLTSLGKE